MKYIKVILASAILLLVVMFSNKGYEIFYELEEDIRYVYPMGNIIGIKASTEGVLVLGYEDDDKEYIGGIRIGDVIVSINGILVKSALDVSEILNESKKDYIDIVYLRDNKYIETKIKTKKIDEEYKLGLWIRDKISGVGTMTCYDPNNNEFYALGHPICDYDTKEEIFVHKGNIYYPSTFSINKSSEKDIGNIEIEYDQESIGLFNKNSEYGISGNLNAYKEKYTNMMAVGNELDVYEGKAKILFEDKEGNVVPYDIFIREVIKETSKDQDMIIEIVDKELLEYTGGIVQGMSGSPIIQDNKIIGAITHVFRDNPKKGYGIYINKMIE